jgi:uncharacterized membrane protein
VSAAGEPEPDGDEHAIDLERIVFFSDAVFAIAITLLILEIRLPELPDPATGEEVAEALRSILPAIGAYALSFATIGLYWLAHWRRYRSIERADETLAALNLVGLGLVAFIPFPTALIGSHGDTPLVVAIYAIALSAAGVAGTVTWLYARRAGLIRRDLPAALVRVGALRGLAVPVVMLGSLPLLGVVGPYGVELAWLLIVPVQLVVVRVARRGGAGQAAPGGAAGRGRGSADEPR